MANNINDPLSEKKKSDKEKEKSKQDRFVFQIGNIERNMIEELKEEPYFVNMAGYLRASIRHLYAKKIKGKDGKDSKDGKKSSKDMTHDE